MSPSPLKRFRTGLAALGVIFVLSVCGYWVAGWTLLDSVYQVVLVLSTVGLEEAHDLSDSPALKIHTILVMVFGVSAVFYILGGLIQMMTEGDINRALGMLRLDQKIEQLRGHTIVCGFGRMGEILADQLARRRRPFVIVENDPARIAEAKAKGYLTVNDNATEETAMNHAGIQHATTLVTTLPSDADNVFISLTARNLSPDLKIIARGEYPTTEKKLMQAGADRVVLPAATGALRMAAMITRPSAVELIEVVTGRQISEVEIDELVIPANSSLAGKTVRDSEMRSKHGLLIVAIRPPGGNVEFNPSGDSGIPADGTVIVMGHQQDIDRFRRDHGV